MATFSVESNKLVCKFDGRMDTETCISCEEQIFDKVRQSREAVCFDLQGVDYISSNFLGICMKVYKEKGQDKFSIINLHPNVKKVFKIAGFDRYLEIK